MDDKIAEQVAGKKHLKKRQKLVALNITEEEYDTIYVSLQCKDEGNVGNTRQTWTEVAYDRTQLNEGSVH